MQVHGETGFCNTLKLKNSNGFTITAVRRIWDKESMTMFWFLGATLYRLWQTWQHSDTSAHSHKHDFILTVSVATLYPLSPTWQHFKSHWFHTESTLSDKTVCWPSFLPQYASSIQGGYLNFRAWVMKNVLFGQEKIKLWTKWQSVKIKQKLCSSS